MTIFLLCLEVFSVLLSIAGAVFVASSDNYWRWFGFFFWSISNPLLVVLFICTSHYPMAALYVFFTATSIIGCINNWKIK